ncbi:hypothetical protein Tco_0029469, partial [Tanacetum coccineum]
VKVDFEEFKKYEDDKVEQRYAEINARLDALSIDFDEVLYPHMLTAIAGRRWVIGHSIRLAVMKCAESTEPRQEANDKLVKALQDLKGDTGEDTLQRIRDLHPSSSQLKIPMYPEVRNPKDPWAVKEEMLLEDARSDGIPVSVPTVAPQGLAILLVDAATQTEVSEGEASPRLLRSKSLPPMYNLD